MPVSAADARMIACANAVMSDGLIQNIRRPDTNLLPISSARDYDIVHSLREQFGLDCRQRVCVFQGRDTNDVRAAASQNSSPYIRIEIVYQNGSTDAGGQIPQQIEIWRLARVVRRLENQVSDPEVQIERPSRR